MERLPIKTQFTYTKNNVRLAVGQKVWGDRGDNPELVGRVVEDLRPGRQKIQVRWGDSSRVVTVSTETPADRNMLRAERDTTATSTEQGDKGRFQLLPHTSRMRVTVEVDSALAAG